VVTTMLLSPYHTHKKAKAYKVLFKKIGIIGSISNVLNITVHATANTCV
jgi:hypothetical protein